MIKHNYLDVSAPLPVWRLAGYGQATIDGVACVTDDRLDHARDRLLLIATAKHGLSGIQAVAWVAAEQVRAAEACRATEAIRKLAEALRTSGGEARSLVAAIEQHFPALAEALMVGSRE